MEDEEDPNLMQEFDNTLDQKDEVLALESIFADTGRFCIENPAEEDGSLLSLCIKVTVSEIEEGGITVDALMPCENDHADSSELSSSPQAEQPTNNRPVFQRSQSGNHWHSSFSVHYLTPLTLHATFPLHYPSAGPPIFTVSCLWLSAQQLTSLCRQLDRLWEESAGMPIIFTWVDWLENNILSYLGLERRVILVPHAAGCDENSSDEEGMEEHKGGEESGACSAADLTTRDPRALPECYELEAALISLLSYNREKEIEEFYQTTQECGICFEEKLGQGFFLIPECGHHFCHECLGGYVEMHVSDGTVQQLMCMSQDCKMGVPPNIIRAILGDEAFSRWERLLLQKTLETMGDVVWCPRCNQPVIRDEQEELNLGHCTNCFYSFCTLCEEAWHMGTKCNGTEEMLQQIREKSKQTNKGDRKLTAEESKAANKLWHNYLSKMTIKKTSRSCPKCKVPIEKNMGCNSVTCSLCGTKMCWSCGNKISGYDHFGKSCSLFDTIPTPQAVPVRRELHPGAARIQRELILNPNAQEQMRQCPKCKQRNLKENRNNHIRCWSCKVNFCFMCCSAIIGQVTSHFKAPNACVQHSDH